MPPHESVRAALLAEKERTGVGPHALLSRAGDVPRGLSITTILEWLNGARLTGRPRHIAWTLQTWRSLPSVSWVEITPALLRTLKSERSRTGIGPKALISRMPRLPDGLTSAIIATWFRRAARGARADHIAFVLDAYKALPDAENAPRVTITSELRRELIALRDRTGVGPQALLRARRDKPPGLGADLILLWISGAVKSAREDHFAYVLRLWNGADPVLPVTNDLRARLLEERRRTGISAAMLLRGDLGAPEGLKPSIVEGWLSGACKSARRSFLDHVMRRWQELPDGSASRSSGHGVRRGTARIIITDPMRAELIRERLRTGVLISLRLRRDPDAPEGLTPTMISGWLKGKIRSARADHWNYVLNWWRALPDAPLRRRQEQET
jgi:hypothetical protein